MRYVALVLADSPVSFVLLDDASGVPFDRGSTQVAFTHERGTPAYRRGHSPIGRAMGYGTGWFTSNSGMRPGRVDYTIGAWIRTTSTDSTRAYTGSPANCVAGDWTSSVLRGFGVHDGKVQLTRFTTNSVWDYTTGAISVNDGGWHLIAASCTAAGQITLVVDGVQDVQATPALEFNSSGSFACYGASYSNGTATTVNDHFDGDVAGQFISATPLSTARLLEYYRAGLRDGVVIG